MENKIKDELFIAHLFTDEAISVCWKKMKNGKVRFCFIDNESDCEYQQVFDGDMIGFLEKMKKNATFDGDETALCNLPEIADYAIYAIKTYGGAR